MLLAKVPAEWAAYFDWTQSRATPETKKHGHVWIVVSDNWRYNNCIRE